jgi:hypothetical protein
MDWRYAEKRELSEEDVRAIDYMAEQAELGGQFRLGQYEQNYTIEGTLMRGSYEIGDRHMRIHDTVWGTEYIGGQPYDQLLIQLARTPLFRRLQSIEQLTLPVDYTTMPNSMYFSRWEHIWGSVVFVRKMLEGRDDIDDRQKMILQLRTLLSDVGHTAFSHLGDWMFQGYNGGEDMHDQDLKDILRVSGVEEILASQDFGIDETVFPDIADWIECPAPDLCVDRIDYGFREILRWVSPTIPVNMYLRELHDPQSAFEITETGRLVFKDQKMARMYATGFSLLPTEHHAHPVHRAQLQLFESGIRASVINKVEFESIHPREALYGIDSDFMMHLHTWEMKNLHEVMKQIGLTQRQIFIGGRRADLNYIFRNVTEEDWQFPAFPDPLKAYTWQSQFFGKPYPASIKLKEVAEVPVDALQWNPQGLIINLPPLKARFVDPPVLTNEIGDNGLPHTSVKCLSELEPSYASYLAGQKRMMAKAYRATILMRPDVARLIVNEHTQAIEHWPALLERPRSAERLRETIYWSESAAAANRLDSIREVEDQTLLFRRKLGEQGVLFGL